MFIFGKYGFHVYSESVCFVNSTGPLVSDPAVDMEGSVCVMRFLEFI